MLLAIAASRVAVTLGARTFLGVFVFWMGKAVFLFENNSLA
jgi:hypothetical protein